MQRSIGKLALLDHWQLKAFVSLFNDLREGPAHLLVVNARRGSRTIDFAWATSIPIGALSDDLIEFHL